MPLPQMYFCKKVCIPEISYGLPLYIKSPPSHAKYIEKQDSLDRYEIMEGDHTDIKNLWNTQFFVHNTTNKKIELIICHIFNGDIQCIVCDNDILQSSDDEQDFMETDDDESTFGVHPRQNKIIEFGPYLSSTINKPGKHKIIVACTHKNNFDDFALYTDYLCTNEESYICNQHIFATQIKYDIQS